MSDSVETTTQEQTQAQSGLTIADLILVAQMIQRGAGAGIFKADELKAIGDFYDRLIKFLESAGALVRQEQPSAQAAPAESEATQVPQGE